MLRKIQMGQKIKSPRIELFKGQKDKKAIISVVSREGILCAVTHYAPGIGTIHCFEGKCCADCGPAKVYYLLPIVIYHIKDIQSHTVDLTQKVDLRALRMGEESYNKLIDNDSMLSLDRCDLLVTTEDEKFQRMDFKILLDQTGGARPPAWRMDDLTRRAVLQEYEARYLPLLEQSIGKVLNPETYEAAKKNAEQNRPTVAAPAQSPSMPPKPQFQEVPMETREQITGPAPSSILPVQQSQPVAGLQGAMPESAPPSSTFTAPVVEAVSDQDIANLM